ncbi:MAG: beta-propeller fold lactonase family protein, partial [Xanthomonadales bacterium]|nr:beta-propeller fold lactonase family protein [Xanthomonadales bacterium]
MCRVLSRLPGMSVVTLGLMLFSMLGLLLVSTPSLALEYVYTANNYASGNGIHGYRITSGGTLEELPGSPFASGGFGDDNSAFSQNGLVVSPDQQFLFAVNHGSNDISVFRVARNGRLFAVEGSPFPSGGELPSSLSLSGDVLYVSFLGDANAPPEQGCVGCELRGFRMQSGGALVPIANSSIALENIPAGRPLAIQFNPAGSVLFGSLTIASAVFELGQPELFSYELDHETGLLSASPGSPYTVRDGSAQPLGFAFNPANPSHVYTANVVSGVPDLPSSVSAYLMAHTGQVAELDFSPVPAEVTPGDAIAACWAKVTFDGNNLYTANAGSDNLSHFRLAESGEPTLAGLIATPTVGNGPNAPVDLLILPGDRYLYVLQTVGANIAAWDIDLNNGDLIELPNQPLALPADATPYGLVYVDRRNGALILPPPPGQDGGR